MTIDLTPEETEILKKLIHHEVEEINPEIHHTGKAAMRDELKQYRDTLTRLYERLGGE
jgi:hypothetical protein